MERIPHAMDTNRFDFLSRSLRDARSRRGALTSVLGGTLGLLGLAETDAKKKKGKGKKGKGKKGGKGGKGTPPPPPPPPVVPVATADAACAATGIGTSNARLAQTFRALRSGQLTSASVFLTSNIDGADFDLEIWSVNEANAPSTILAGATIADVPETTNETGTRTLTGTFPTPATVVAGLRYALVITGPPNQGYYLVSGLNNPCPDGTLFGAPSANAPFVASTSDLRFETVVTA